MKLGARFVELPPEAKTLLGSVHGVECSVYQLQSNSADHAKLLIEADKAMSKRKCDRIVGVIDDNQLVAIYAPRDQSTRNMTFSVMVLTGHELVCATARGDLDPVLQLGGRVDVEVDGDLHTGRLHLGDATLDGVDVFEGAAR